MMIFGLHIILYFLHFLLISSEVRLPPYIFKNTSGLLTFREDNVITLHCRANGYPEPKYTWTSKGLIIPNNKTRFEILNGSLTIRSLKSIDQGKYQCTAENEHGKSIGPIVTLQLAQLESLSDNEVKKSPYMEQGDSYMIPCKQAKSVPIAKYTWETAKSITEDSKMMPVKLDNRIQMDEEANLYFAHLLPLDSLESENDEKSVKVYKCIAFNSYMDTRVGGSYSIIQIKPSNDEIKKVLPLNLFASISPMTVLEGQILVLRCFFSGYPTPIIKWSRIDNIPLPTTRMSIEKFGSELRIKFAQPSDQSIYVCHGSNSEGFSENSIQVELKAAPIFRHTSDKPHNMNITEGLDAVFKCRPYAIPNATIVWMKNGEKLDLNNLPSKYYISPDSNTLTISNVCKSCPGVSDQSDLAVIQCLASNFHGQILSEGYLNVLEKTKLTIFPNNSLVKASDTSVLINCSGISDISTPIKYQWYRINQELNREEKVKNIPGLVNINERNGTLMFTINHNTSRWQHIVGYYKCIISNGYSSDYSTISIQMGDDLIPISIVGANMFDFWWLWLLLMLLSILILFLFLICCLCRQSQISATYRVDKKERINGLNPVKELIDSGFHDYKRPDGHVMTKGSMSTLASTFEGDIDRGSFSEYGDIDAGKFVEDGSFIGDYGWSPIRKPRY